MKDLVIYWKEIPKLYFLWDTISKVKLISGKHCENFKHWYKHVMYSVNRSAVESIPCLCTQDWSSLQTDTAKEDNPVHTFSSFSMSKKIRARRISNVDWRFRNALTFSHLKLAGENTPIQSSADGFGELYSNVILV